MMRSGTDDGPSRTALDRRKEWMHAGCDEMPLLECIGDDGMKEYTVWRGISIPDPNYAHRKQTSTGPMQSKFFR